LVEVEWAPIFGWLFKKKKAPSFRQRPQLITQAKLCSNVSLPEAFQLSEA
jgi:hypothetical protein